MKERIIFGYDAFVLPFTIGMIFIILYLGVGLVRIIAALSKEDRIKLVKSFVSPTLIKTIKDIIFDCLLHVKIFKKNLLLGYMHASIAFGWFMLIFIGHIEVMIYTPQRNGVLYYPVFFRYFVMETQETLRGAFFFFLMDFFLLMVLSGIALAIYKRFKSRALGMRRTTRLSKRDTIALYALWAIFPLRLLAESFTADISGGSFLTKSINHLFHNFVNNSDHILPVWWAYSSALGIFLFALPFSRYMHIPTEMLLIVLRNAGIKSDNTREGFAETEIYSCSSCGICIDACPMTTHKRNLNNTTVYFLRFLRRRNKRKPIVPADKCLMCGKCVELCPVGIDSCRLKQFKRSDVSENGAKTDYTYLSSYSSNVKKGAKILYYSGCMTHLTPNIYKALFNVLDKANLNYEFLDKDGSICCGRPLMLSGRKEEAKGLVEKNSRLIKESGADILLVSCPICYKMFNEEYDLGKIKLLHHTQLIDSMIADKTLNINKSDKSFVFHDPCELGRGSNIYKQPRRVLTSQGRVVEANFNKKESICCGGSLGSLALSKPERDAITKHSIESLTYNKPDTIVTACPLCYKTFSQLSGTPVKDIAQVTAENLI